ncbi:DUF4870 domain-containing protein [Dysgonomonas sp. 521]|uniref:DUF4870 domain-containing protein n=1 Tax=Dysgonomonas sp. 521 TaxID=2302932 RepID=UPI0013D56160|nr:DUF4870 domain-containing protein [Dysgonomonas sp. 521]NDV96323.1 DUF4870 domain-containing protein [Dysgonomonas sp. 521]
MDKYENLRILEDLRSKGAISEEEFQREKSKILNSPYQEQRSNSLGMEENSYLTLMHLSQFAGFIVVGLGFILPIVMWLVNADKSEAVNRHGKNIANFMLSMFIYITVSLILCLLLIGIPMLIALGIIEVVFIIIAAIKANGGEYWKYPLSIQFFT